MKSSAKEYIYVHTNTVVTSGVEEFHYRKTISKTQNNQKKKVNDKDDKSCNGKENMIKIVQNSLLVGFLRTHTKNGKQKSTKTKNSSLSKFRLCIMDERIYLFLLPQKYYFCSLFRMEDMILWVMLLYMLY